MSKVKSKKKPIDFSSGFSDAVAANQKVWAHDRSTTVGASEAFDCIRKNVFKKRFPEMATQAEEEDPEWGHTERGNLIENAFVVPVLKHMFGESNCHFMGDDQQTFVDGRLSATPDGIVTDQPEDALLNYGVESIGETGVVAIEVKSFGNEYAAPKKYKDVDTKNPNSVVVRYTPKPKHQGQVIIQMGILRRKMNYSPDYGAVIYVNPVNLQDTRIATVKYDDDIYIRAKARADEVFDESREIKDYPPEGKITGFDCTYCDFCDACNKVEMSRLPGKARPTLEFTVEEQNRLEELARKVAEMRTSEKEMEIEKKKYEAELREFMFDMDTNRAAGEGWSVSISKNNGRKTLDKDRIIEEFNIDVDDYMKEGNPFFVMRVKCE